MTDEVYISYLWTRKIVLGLKDLSSFNITGGQSADSSVFRVI